MNLVIGDISAAISKLLSKLNCMELLGYINIKMDYKIINTNIVVMYLILSQNSATVKEKLEEFIVSEI